LTEHLEWVERELKSTLWLWKLWRVVRLASGLCDYILLGMRNRHDINLDLNLSSRLDLAVLLSKHLEPESTDVLLVKLHLDVLMLLVDDIFVVLLVEAESCLGEGYVFEKVADVYAILTNDVIFGEEISIIELNGKLSNFLRKLDSVDQSVLEVGLSI